ncbi:MAG: TonB-dependent receptor, partial [Myxococcota bacterium]
PYCDNRSRDGWTFSGSGRVLTGINSFIATITLREVYLDELLSSQAHVQVNSPYGVSARVFWNHFRASGGPTESPVGSITQDFEDLRSDVVDAEVVYQDTFDFFFENQLAVGTSYRLKNIRWLEYLREEQTQNHFAAFFEDNIRFSPSTSLLLSARVDRHPLFDALQFSPRGSLVVRPTDDSAVRLVVGRAFRNPTFTESYVENRTPLSQGPGLTAFGVGNEDLEPESIVSYELGYSKEFDLLNVELNAYYNRFSNAILNQGRLSPTLTDNSGFVEDVDAFLVREVSFVNDEAVFRQLGGELGARAFPADGLDVYANVSLHDTSPTSSSRELDLEGREDDERTSRYKFNAGLQYRSEFGLDVGVDLNVVGSQFWVIRVPTDAGFEQSGFRIPAYTLVNARVGYRLVEDLLEVAVSGTNLLNDVHRQHPFSAQRLTRRVFATAILRL